MERARREVQPRRADGRVFTYWRSCVRVRDALESSAPEVGRATFEAKPAGACSCGGRLRLGAGRLGRAVPVPGIYPWPTSVTKKTRPDHGLRA